MPALVPLGAAEVSLVASDAVALAVLSRAREVASPARCIASRPVCHESDSRSAGDFSTTCSTFTPLPAVKSAVSRPGSRTTIHVTSTSFVPAVEPPLRLDAGAGRPLPSNCCSCTSRRDTSNTSGAALSGDHVAGTPGRGSEASSSRWAPVFIQRSADAVRPLA
eukprot:349984-Chlamydomonas_euryale.AAC.8